jgi:uncharacterized Zn finger protein
MANAGLSGLVAQVKCMGRKCPSCGSDKTIPWLGGIAAGKSRTLYHCEHCGYFGPILSERANSQESEYGF